MAPPTQSHRLLNSEYWLLVWGKSTINIHIPRIACIVILFCFERRCLFSLDVRFYRWWLLHNSGNASVWADVDCVQCSCYWYSGGDLFVYDAKLDRLQESCYILYLLLSSYSYDHITIRVNFSVHAAIMFFWKITTTDMNQFNSNTGHDLLGSNA